MHPVTRARLAQTREIRGMIHAHAARTLYQRFDDHRGDLVGVFLEHALHVLELAQ